MPMVSQLKEFEILLVEHVFEKFSRWTQKWFGLDCFLWATITQTMIAQGIGLHVVRERLDFLSGLIWTTLSTMNFFCAIKNSYRRGMVYRELLQMMRNHLLFTENNYRTIILTGLLAQALFLGSGYILSSEIELNHVIPILLMTSFSYLGNVFTACTPLPPGPSKLRKGINNLKSKLAELGSGSDGLAPQPT